MIREATKLAFQGDIFVLEVDELPAGAVKLTKALNTADRDAYGYHPTRGLVLAQGESRQHYHHFPDTKQVELWHIPAANDNQKEKLYVVLKSEQVLQHDEHDGIKRKAGVHRFGFQFETTFEDEYRRVAD